MDIQCTQTNSPAAGIRPRKRSGVVRKLLYKGLTQHPLNSDHEYVYIYHAQGKSLIILRTPDYCFLYFSRLTAERGLRLVCSHTDHYETGDFYRSALLSCSIPLSFHNINSAGLLSSNKISLIFY